jgi:ABC-type antimicrobial peptide transport system permease subunit
MITDEKLDGGLVALSYISIFVTVISLCLSFFSLTVTMSSNMRDSTKELAILRYIG